MGFKDTVQLAKDAKELFSSKGVKPEDKPSVEAIREILARAYHEVNEIVPPGRYQAIVKTHLETAAMFAVKAFTHAE
jgi:coenzyme F420-reducing hydrogenase beta subunit